MPASQYHVRYVKDLNTLIGEKVKGIIIDYNPKRRRAILFPKNYSGKRYERTSGTSKRNERQTF